jgi:hypothetical protein
MINKAFNDWFHQHANIHENKWTDFTGSKVFDPDKTIQSICTSFDAWTQIRNPNDLHGYLVENPEDGLIIVNQTGEFTMIHNISTLPVGRIFGFVTNNMGDNPVEVVLHDNAFKPIAPTFKIKWNAPPAINDTTNDEHETAAADDIPTNYEHEDTNIFDTDTAHNDPAEDTTPVVTKKSAPATKKKKNVTCRSRKSQQLDVGRNVRNSCLIVPPAIIHLLLTIKQPFDFTKIRNTLDEFDLDTMATASHSEYTK